MIFILVVVFGVIVDGRSPGSVWRGWGRRWDGGGDGGGEANVGHEDFYGAGYEQVCGNLDREGSDDGVGEEESGREGGFDPLLQSLCKVREIR